MKGHPKPSVLKLGHRPKREDPAGVGTPQTPKWLDTEARRLWKRMRGSLPADLITRADEGVLLVAAESLAQYRRLIRKIREENVPIVDSATMAIHRAAALYIDKYLAAAARLGLSPVDRARLATDPRDKPDPLGAFLAGKPAALPEHVTDDAAQTG